MSSISSNSQQPTSSRRRVVHGAWAGLALAACLYLVLTKQTGHPPPITLVPFVVVAWLAGHGLIWGVQRLAARGRSTGAVGTAGDARWPAVLLLAAFGTACVAFVGIVQLLGTALQRRWYPYHDAALWTTMLVVSLAHAATFAGLLSRRGWSRPAGAALAVGWAAGLGLQLLVQWRSAATTDTAAVLVVRALILALLSFAALLAWSRRVRSFLEH